MRRPRAKARRSRALHRLRVWVVLRLQERRRKRANSVPPVETPAAPVITAGSAEFGMSEPGWFDTTLEFNFEHGSFPVAQLEVWLSIGGGAYGLVATIPSNWVSWEQQRVEQAPDTLLYKLRYVNGAVVGPFSNVWQIDP